MTVMDSDAILKLIEEGEGVKIEWKDSRILDNPFKLARSMSAIANQEGGIILVGVKDDGTIEGMKAKKGHQEHIMNIATDKCEPPIIPSFQKVIIPRQGDVYVISIPKKRGVVFHAIKTKDGYSYHIRIGSRIRPMRPEELSHGKNEGVEVEPLTPLEMIVFWLGKKILLRKSKTLNVSLRKAYALLITGGILSMLISFFLMFRIENGNLVVLLNNNPVWLNVLLVLWFILGAFLAIILPQLILKTQCPVCKSYFAYRRVKSAVLDKRAKGEGEEWTVRNLYTCDVCQFQEQKLEYEDVDTQ